MRNHTEKNGSDSGFSSRALVAIALCVIAASALAAFVPGEQFECNNGVMGPNDLELVFGDPVMCDAGDACVTIGRDFNQDGHIDEVENICLPNPVA